jgi:hypothetical protein
MPALLNDLKTKGYFKIRIQLADAFDKADPEEAGNAAAWEGAWLDLRELNATEAADLASLQDGPDKGSTLLAKLKDVIVDHNIEREAGKKASTEEVAEAIRWSATVYNHVIGEWVSHLPLSKRSGGNSAK